MDGWGVVVKRLREARGLSQSQLAVLSGLARSYISRIEIGQIKTSSKDTFAKLAKGLGLSLDELNAEIIGKGLKSRIESPEETLERFRIAMPTAVPVYEELTFHAGEPREPLDYVPMGRDQARGKRLEAYIVHGSCLEPEIKDGSIVVVDRNGQIDNGDIVVCLIDGELHIARLRKIADEAYVENNHGRHKLSDVPIAAPVIEVRRRLK